MFGFDGAEDEYVEGAADAAALDFSADLYLNYTNGTDLYQNSSLFEETILGLTLTGFDEKEEEQIFFDVEIEVSMAPPTMAMTTTTATDGALPPPATPSPPATDEGLVVDTESVPSDEDLPPDAESTSRGGESSAQMASSRRVFAVIVFTYVLLELSTLCQVA